MSNKTDCLIKITAETNVPLRETLTEGNYHLLNKLKAYKLSSELCYISQISPCYNTYVLTVRFAYFAQPLDLC